MKILTDTQNQQNLSSEFAQREYDKNQSYLGYPLWRKTDFKEQKEIMSRILGNDHLKYQNCDTVTKCQYLTQKLMDQNQQFSAIEQWALLTCLRKEIGN